MKLNIGVDSFIWSENFSLKDLWIIGKAKELGFSLIDFAISDPFRFPTQAVRKELERVGMDCVCTTTLTDLTNPISPNAHIRTRAVEALKKAIDYVARLAHPCLAGVNYASWSYLTKRPRTEDEWEWSVDCMREAAGYAKKNGGIKICGTVKSYAQNSLQAAERSVVMQWRDR